MRGLARGVLGALSVVTCVLGLASDAGAQARIDATHRAALERFLRASRTLAVIGHAGVPAMIAAAAMNEWGFGLSDLRVAEIVPDVDTRALEHRIVEIHARHLTAQQAAAAADFYDSGPGRRVLRDVLRDSLPPSDPLVAADAPPPTDADRRAFQQFSESPIGTHVKAVTARINEEVLHAVGEAADRAIARYVARTSRPHRRSSGAPAGSSP